MRWRFLLAWGCAVAATSSGLGAAETPTNALPSLETVLHGIVERAQADARLEQEFKAHYTYTYTKNREEYNLKGRLKKKILENEDHHPPAAHPDGAGSPNGPEERNGTSRSDGSTVSWSDDEPPDRSYERRDVLVSHELLRRFEFTIVGREVWKGVPLLKLDFRPVADGPPTKGLLERFISRIAGTIWVDEADFTVALASFYLTEKVNVGAGILGSVSAFECWFERAKTDEGIWHTRRVNWRVQCREFLVHEIVEQRETWENVRKVVPP